jgi:hypothetical protein
LDVRENYLRNIRFPNLKKEQILFNLLSAY